MIAVAKRSASAPCPTDKPHITPRHPHPHILYNKVYHRQPHPSAVGDTPFSIYARHGANHKKMRGGCKKKLTFS